MVDRTANQVFAFQRRKLRISSRYLRSRQEMPLEAAEKRQKELPIPSMWPSILRLLRKFVQVNAQ